MRRRNIIIGLIFVLVISLVSLIIGFATSLGILESFRIIFGAIYVLFLPGFIISYIFFPKTKEFESNERLEVQNLDNKERASIDWIERIALSFALSIATVPLVVFYLNLIGVKINLLNSFFTILGIIVISGGIIIIRLKRKRIY